MDKLSVVVCVDAERIELRGTSIELHARLERAPVVPPVPPIPPVPIPPPHLVGPIPHPLKPPPPIPEAERAKPDTYPKNPNGYVPIVIEEVQTPRTTWDDIHIDPARPYGTKPDFKIFRQDTR